MTDFCSVFVSKQPKGLRWPNPFCLVQYGDRHFLSTLKIAKCKLQKGPKVSFVKAPRRRPVHKETLVLVWNSSTVTRTMVKERL